MSHKVIITCAVTDSIHTPSMSPYLPVTSSEIVNSAVEAAAAGAAILHLHARDPETGRPDQRPEAFVPILQGIKQQTDAVLNLTSGGAPTMTIAERRAHPAIDDLQARARIAQYGQHELWTVSDARALQDVPLRLGGALPRRQPRSHLPQHLCRCRVCARLLCRRRNALRVRVLRAIVEGLGLEIATPADARDILALKGANSVAF